MQEVFMVAIVFAGFFYIIKMFTDFLLKRRIVKSGHIEKADILSPVKPVDEEPQRMKSLKWAMVAIMGGAGFIVAYVVGKMYGMSWRELDSSLISFGIELMFVGLGFLFYFLIANKQK